MSFFCFSQSLAHSWGALERRKGLWGWGGRSPLDRVHPSPSTGPVAPFGSGAEPNSRLLEIKVGDEQCPIIVPSSSHQPGPLNGDKMSPFRSFLGQPAETKVGFFQGSDFDRSRDRLQNILKLLLSRHLPNLRACHRVGPNPAGTSKHH